MRTRIVMSFGFGSVVALALSMQAACGGDSPAAGTPDASSDAPHAADASSDAGTDAPGDTKDSGPDAADAGLTAFCAARAAWETACSYPPTCDGGRSYGCNEFDLTVNSIEYETASMACLTSANCDVRGLRDCDDRRYGAMQLSAAQAKLVQDYCTTCSPGDNTCVARSTTYDADAGPLAIPFIFSVAWELNDAVENALDTTCTGGALVVDGGTCPDAFANCSQGVIFALPAIQKVLFCK